MSRAVNIPLMQWNPTVEAALAQTWVRYQDHNMFSSPSWGSVARFDMPLQLSRLNTIYLDDYLKVTGEQI